MPQFPRHWYLGIAFVLTVSWFALVPQGTVAASSNIHLGVSDYVPGGVLGSWGTIGMTTPQGSASFEFIKTSNYYQGVEHFVQIGWTHQDFCGTFTTVMWEWFNGSEYSSQYYNKPYIWCENYFPTGDDDYATQYDPGNGWWCFDRSSSRSSLTC